MLRCTLVSSVFVCLHSWIRPCTLHLLSAVRRTEAFWKLCTTWKCFLLHHMFRVHSDSHTLNSGHCIAVCMQELTYSLHLHTDITVQYRSHTCLPTALTDIWLLQPVYLYRYLFGCCYRHMHPSPCFGVIMLLIFRHWELHLVVPYFWDNICCIRM